MRIPREAESLVDAGEDLFEAGDHAGALERAEAALRIAPGFLAAVSLKAASHDALDEVEEAREAYEDALRLAPSELDVVAASAEFYVRRGAEDANADWLQRGRALARGGAESARRADAELATDFTLIEVDAFNELGLARDALARIDDALQDRPSDARLRVERGLTLFELCRFDEARTQLEDVVRDDPGNASATHTLGALAERCGDHREASRRFRRAHELAPDDYPIPVRVSHDEFDRAIEDALDELPRVIRDYLSNVAITVEDVPASEDLLAADPPLSPSILGIFRGSAIGDKASMDPWSHFPSSIILFQKNLERFATNRRDLVEQIRVTLLHEVGHFLGLDEDQLRDRGLD